MHRYGIPALSCIDNSWMGTSLKSKQASPQIQWVETGCALRFAVSEAFWCRYYLSNTKCDLVPTQTLSYLGILCDSHHAVFRQMPQDKLEIFEVLIDAALRDKSISVATLPNIAGKWTSMEVAIQPAALWTHFLFDTFCRKSPTLLMHVRQHVTR